MADTYVSAGLTAEQWDDKFFTEYLTENRFASEMGTNESNIIQVKENLTKKKGDRINFALVNKLTNAAVLGSSTLEGNEEDMASRSFDLTVNKRRNGVRVAEIDEQFSAISLREASKVVLKEWSLKDTETLIIEALASKNGVNYSSASEAQKDAWLVDNADRVLFGAATSNNSANDHSASLANCDTTADKLTTDAISLMKFMALTTASPRIRPVRIAANGRHYFVLYADPRLFRDLQSNATITQAQREVNLEMENNRLFQGGDLLWNGVIIKEVHEMYDVLATAGGLNIAGNGGNTAVGCAFLCGAQALGAAYAKRWTSRQQTFDYGDKPGVAIEAIYGIGKMQFGRGVSDRDDLVDHGCVTGYFATT
ncbi:MAG: N4-gp56 family major capsid protein [Methylocystis sp.]